MAEDLTLTTPIVQPSTSLTTFRVVFLLFDWDLQAIGIRLRGSTGETRTYTYGGDLSLATPADRAKALALMRGLNKANLSTKSLQKRVLEQLVLDYPELAGAVTGAPD